MQEQTIIQDVVEGFRLSPQQKRLWLLQRQEEDGHPYRAYCTVLIEGDADGDALRRAVEQVVERHEILRTSFRCLEGVSLPLQVVANAPDVLMREDDLCGLPSPEQDARVEELLKESREAGFNLEQGPLLHARLLILSPSKRLLFISLPALCADVDGLKNLVCEIDRSYKACVSGEVLWEEPIAYADVADIFNELIEAADTETGREFWRQLDAADYSDVRLPFERSQGATEKFSPQVYVSQIDAGVERKIEELSDRSDAPTSDILLACWLVLLWRLDEQAANIVGIAQDGRTYEGLEDAPGLFARYLPLRCRFDGRARFDEMLKRVAEAVGELYQWQDYFSWELLEGIEREASETSFFSACFDFKVLPESFKTSGLAFSIEHSYACIDRFRLKLSCVARAGEIALEFHYDSSLYAASDIAHLAALYQQLLHSAANFPATAISELEIVTPFERQRLLHEFNATNADYPQEKCLHELFEEQAARLPEAVAVVFGDEQVTYAELNARANQLARHLQTLGIGREVPVGLFLERSVEMVVALLGILKAGGAYVPLDSQYPPERLAFMLEDARIKTILTMQPLSATLPAHSAQVVHLDAEGVRISEQSQENLSNTASADNLIYVIYTSGSTGKPKGAMLTHRGIVNCLWWMQQTYQLNDTDRFLLRTSLNFDPSVWEVFWPLCVGASVVIARPDAGASVAYLIDLIIERQITSLYLVPTLLRAFLEEPQVSGIASLRRVICGGEALPVETLRRFFTLFDSELHHSYGPTETSIAATEWRCEPQREKVCIGRPLANTEVYLLDAGGQVVPEGCAGELYVGGVGVGRGYLHRTELTAGRFVPDGFSGRYGARLYRTGDLARYGDDGQIEFLGRVDHQVKVSGYRIEPGEIEALLNTHTGVRESLVLAREERQGDKRLVAYVLEEPGQNPTAKELRGLLVEKLPPYMIPAKFLMLKQWPLMPNGKVDRLALPAPEQVGIDADGDALHTRTAVEEILAGIWEDALGVERVGLEDNFFELGGHSLLATQLISRARKAFKVELELRQLFERPTVAGLARQVEQALSVGTMRAQPIQPVSRDAELPLSFTQQRLWYLYQVDPDSSFYNLPSAVRLNGQLDIAALELTLNEVVHRHESFRTSFKEVNARPVLSIAPASSLSLQIVELTSLPEDEREQEARRRALEEARRPFDLARGPLLRATLLRLAGEEHMLLLTMHHIISDLLSAQVLVREMVMLYKSFSSGQPSPLPALEIQYADYAYWQQQWLQGEVLKSQMIYWKKQLADIPSTLQLQTDRPRPAVQSFEGKHQRVSLSKTLSAEVKAFSRREGVTLFMTLLAAWKATLYLHSSQEDILVGFPFANRNRAEVENIIGLFLNTLVLRTDLSGDPTFHQLLSRVRDVALAAYAHQDMPFEKLVAELKPERSLSHNPLFQVGFILNQPEIESFEVPSLTFHPVELDTGTSQFDLILHLADTPEQLLGTLQFSTDLFDTSTANAIYRHFETILSHMVTSPETRLSALEKIIDMADKQYWIEKAEETKNTNQQLKKVRRKIISGTQIEADNPH